MTLRWWRLGVVVERDDALFTWTFHVRAFTERTARARDDHRVRRHQNTTPSESRPSSLIPPRKPFRSVTTSGWSLAGSCTWRST